METGGFEEKARRLVDELSQSDTWEDLMYKIYVLQAVEAGSKDSDAGRTTDVEEVRAKFGLAK